MEVLEYSKKNKEYDEIYEFFKVIDSYYYPPLSKRSSLFEFIDPIIKDWNLFI